MWIGKVHTGLLLADFVPPQHSHVLAGMDDLPEVMDSDNLPVLLQVAVAHAQFLTIHPFADGNGRTGRALSQALLRNKGVSVYVPVPISAGILRNTSGYFEALQIFRAGNAELIVRLLASAARYAATSGSTLIDQLADEMVASTEKLTGARSQSAAFRILPLLIG